jgi:hypothetical protein
VKTINESLCTSSPEINDQDVSEAKLLDTDVEDQRKVIDKEPFKGAEI